MTIQQNLIEKYWVININENWFDYILEDWKTQLQIAGFSDIDIDFSGFCSQGDGASFTADWRAKWQELDRFDEIYFQSIKDFLKAIEHKHLECFNVYRLPSMYYHENTIRVDDNHLAFAQAEYLTGFIRAICQEIYSSLESEYDYLTSESAIIEALQANEITE